MAARKTPKSFDEQIAAGDYRAQLVALRDHLASALAVAEVREMAPIARQLQVVLKALDDLKVPAASRVDEIARRRDERRRTAAALPDQAGVQNVERN